MKTKTRTLRENEHGGPEMDLDGSSYGFKTTAPTISAVPEANGKFAAGYVWIGATNGCFATVPTRSLLAFADAIRKRDK